jgi:hypothetical protein
VSDGRNDGIEKKEKEQDTLLSRSLCSLALFFCDPSRQRENKPSTPFMSTKKKEKKGICTLEKPIAKRR